MELKERKEGLIINAMKGRRLKIILLLLENKSPSEIMDELQLTYSEYKQQAAILLKAVKFNISQK
jgi:K+/H+ antiporter YhaU regulatory subunit KhtT